MEFDAINNFVRSVDDVNGNDRSEKARTQLAQEAYEPRARCQPAVDNGLAEDENLVHLTQYYPGSPYSRYPYGSPYGYGYRPVPVVPVIPITPYPPGFGMSGMPGSSSSYMHGGPDGITFSDSRTAPLPGRPYSYGPGPYGGPYDPPPYAAPPPAVPYSETPLQAAEDLLKLGLTGATAIISLENQRRMIDRRRW